MNKYFSYDGCSDEFTFHDTLEQAKKTALEDAHYNAEYGKEWDGTFSDELLSGIKETCFGVILGGINLPTRALTDEEKEVYGEEFTELVESPELIEYPVKLARG